jgi:hypothetical protein
MWHQRQRAHISLQLKFLIKAYLRSHMKQFTVSNFPWEYNRIYCDSFYDAVSALDYMVSDDWGRVWNVSDAI